MVGTCTCTCSSAITYLKAHVKYPDYTSVVTCRQ